MGLSGKDYIEFMKKVYIYIPKIPKLFIAQEKRGVTLLLYSMDGTLEKVTERTMTLPPREQLVFQPYCCILDNVVFQQ